MLKIQNLLLDFVVTQYIEFKATLWNISDYMLQRYESN